MSLLETQKISCPCCGETIEVIIDCSVQEQEYIEDCQVCCRPLIFTVALSQESLGDCADGEGIIVTVVPE